MSWILLATPLVGISVLIVVLWIGHWLVPLGHKETVPHPESRTVDYNALVQKTALILGKGVIAIMRDSLDKFAAARAPAAHDMSTEFPQFAKPTSMSFDGSLEFDIGVVGSPASPTGERPNVARRTIGPRSPA